MKRLLTIEFDKLWLNRSSKVLSIAYFGLLLLIVLVVLIKFKIGNFEFDIAEMGIFNFPYIWHFNTYVADYFKFFLAIVIVSMTANEYSYGTLKQNLIDGLSKKEMISSKLLTVISLALLSTIFVFVMTIGLGLTYSSFTEVTTIFRDIDYLFGFFVKLTTFFSFCLFCGILVKRSAFALGFIMLTYLITSILQFLLSFGLKDAALAESMMRFFPTNAMSDIIVEPFTRLSVIKQMGSQLGVSSDKDFGVNYSAVAISVFWCFMFIWGSYKILQKRDL